MGLRNEDGFVGKRDYDTRMPIPSHISARPDDLAQLIEGMVAFDRNAARQLDPVVAASVLAYGSIYTHPFDDGNGRLHRYLIHHVRSQRGFLSPGITLPVSAAIPDRIEDYSLRLLPLVRRKPTDCGVERHQRFCRYFDATSQTAFL